MRFGTWILRSLYREGSLMTVEKTISKYKLDLMGVQEVRWDGGDTEPAGEHTVTCLEQALPWNRYNSKPLRRYCLGQQTRFPRSGYNKRDKS
jgi:hypothetical protein